MLKMAKTFFNSLLIIAAVLIHNLYGLNARDNKNAGNHPQNSFVPVEQIPGTQLYTGIYYQVGIERFPSGWVTWTDKKHPTGAWNYVQIDARADHLPNYRKSGSWYNDTQWFFAPSDTELGWYTLRNRQLPEYLACVKTSDKVESGYHIVLDKNSNPTNPDALWKPVVQTRRSDKEVYKLFVKSLPEDTVTWTWKKVAENVPDSYFIQVDPSPNDKPKYAENMEWYQDALFRFQNIDQEMVAQITQLDLQFMSKIDELRKVTQNGYDTDKPSNFTVTNKNSEPELTNYTVENTDRGQLRLKLEEIPEMKIVSSEGFISPPLYADAFAFKMGKSQVLSSEEIFLDTVETTKATRTMMLQPLTPTMIKFCLEYFNTENSELSIDAIVYLAISEQTERPLNASWNFMAVSGKLPTNLLVNRDVQKLIAGRVQTSRDPLTLQAQRESLLLAGGNSVLGSSEIVGKNEADVRIKANGVVKGRFGYRHFVTSDDGC